MDSGEHFAFVDARTIDEWVRSPGRIEHSVRMAVAEVGEQLTRQECRSRRRGSARAVILSAAAMGLLRRELIDTLGLQATRRFLLRFGYADGYHDTVSLRDRFQWSSPLDGLRAGIALHRLEGIVRAEILKLEHAPVSGRFEEEVVWHDSYVVEQHFHRRSLMRRHCSG